MGLVGHHQHPPADIAELRNCRRRTVEELEAVGVGNVASLDEDRPVPIQECRLVSHSSNMAGTAEFRQNGPTDDA